MAVLALAVASVLPPTACGRGAEERARLVEEARTAAGSDEFEACYQRLKELRTRYPESPEAAEHFRLATFCYRKLWAGSRFDQESIWLTSERAFMFEWFATFFDDEIPRERVVDMLVGYPYSHGLAFLEFGRDHPRMSQWELGLVEDNGRIQGITAERVGSD